VRLNLTGWLTVTGWLSSVADGSLGSLALRLVDSAQHRWPTLRAPAPTPPRRSATTNEKPPHSLGQGRETVGPSAGDPGVNRADANADAHGVRVNDTGFGLVPFPVHE